MPLKLQVVVSRKVGQPGFGSLGASCGVELELDAGLLARDPDAFHARAREAYDAAHRAVQDELDRLGGSGRPDGRPSPGSGPRHVDPTDHAGDPPVARPHPASDSRTNGRPRRPASARQLATIAALARRGAADLDGLLADLGAARAEDLTLSQASALIDTLKDAEAL